MRFFLRFLTILLFFFLLAGGGLYYYLSEYVDVASLTRKLEDEVSRVTGKRFAVNGGLSLSFYPYLSITLNDVELADPDKSTSMASAGLLKARIALEPLLDQEIHITRLYCDKPAVSVTEYADGTYNWSSVWASVAKAGAEGTGNNAGNGAPVQLPAGFTLSSFTLDGFDVSDGSLAYVQLASGGAVAGTAQASVRSLNFVQDNGEWSYSLECDVQSDIVPSRSALVINGRAGISLAPYSFTGTSGEVKLSGEMTFSERTFDTGFSASYRYLPEKDRLILSKTEGHFADMEFGGNINLSDVTTAGWNVRGNTYVKKLSLPLLFGFTENLPASLNHALDSLDGELVFDCNAGGLVVEQLDARLLGMELRGKGSVADFSKPVVYIDVTGDFVDVDRVFPEIMVTPPSELPRSRFTGRPLIIADDENAHDTGSGIESQPVTAENATPEAADDSQNTPATEDEEVHWGYDIRVAAKQAHARGLFFKGLSFRCWPMGERGTYTSYDIEEFYGGSISSLLHIRDGLTLDLALDSIQSDEPVSKLFDEAIFGGLLNAKARLHADARTVRGLLAGLGGKVDASLNNGFVRLQGKRNAKGTRSLDRYVVKALDVSLQGRSKERDPDNASDFWRYDWDMGLAVRLPEQTKDTSASLQSSVRWKLDFDGPVVIDTKTALPVRTTNAATALHWHGNWAPDDTMQSLDVEVYGRLSLDTEKEILSLSEGRLSIPDVSLTGTAQAEKLFGKTVWRGQLDVPKTALGPLFDRFGVELWKSASPNVLTSVAVQGAYEYDGREFSLEDMTCELDSTVIMDGWFRYIAPDARSGGDAYSAYRMDLNVEGIDLDRYLPPRSTDAETADRQTDQRSALLTQTPKWELDWLKTLDLAADLRIKRAVYRNLSLDNLQTRIVAQKGSLRVSPVLADFYGGKLNASYEGRVEDGLAGKLKLNLKNVELEPAAYRLAGDDFLGGQATAYLNLTGTLARNSDWPQKLNGIWGFDIDNGYYSFKGKENEARKKNSFDHATADGVLENGLLRNENLSLRAPFMRMSGKGWMDLVKKTVDYNITVTYAEIPTFPVHIYGDLFHPKTSVREVEILPRTIGKLGGGIFGIFKNVITSPFKMLEHLGSGKQKLEDQ